MRFFILSFSPCSFCAMCKNRFLVSKRYFHIEAANERNYENSWFDWILANIHSTLCPLPIAQPKASGSGLAAWQHKIGISNLCFWWWIWMGSANDVANELATSDCSVTYIARTFAHITCRHIKFMKHEQEQQKHWAYISNDHCALMHTGMNMSLNHTT